MTRYNWQRPDWPRFQYSLEGIQQTLYAYAKMAGNLAGILKSIDAQVSQDAVINLMVEEALTTSQIEGERFDVEDIRSSIRNQLQLNQPAMRVIDRKAEGIAQLMLCLQQTFDQDLSQEMLFSWHQLIFPDARRDGLTAGAWRTDPTPMQIISGPVGHETVFFEAPPWNRVPLEMQQFIDWFNAPQTRALPGPVRAGLAHLYFESIHPFEDGNGRIGRAIAEKALSQDLGYPCIFSLSKAIYATRKQYYQALQQGSGDTIDATPWLTYFVHTLHNAQCQSQKAIAFVVAKTHFWKRYGEGLNGRQEKAIARMLHAGPEGFQGGMNARKYMVITQCAKATATRDLIELYEQGCFKKRPGGGRSTSYELNVEGDFTGSCDGVKMH